MDTDYALGRSDAETARLVLQGAIYAPLTRRLFQDAGLARGMRVVDLGCGAGDVSLLCAEAVGPGGAVLAVDVDARILETARRRCAEAGVHNVEFVAAELERFELPAGIDAIVGRWVLMYLRDPAALLARLARRLSPGGLVVFQEMDLGVPPANHPPTPLLDRLTRLMAPPPGAPGPNVRMGADLHRTLVAAGLPAPALRFEAPIGAGAGWMGWSYLAATARSLAPMLRRHGHDLELDGLDERLRDEALRADAVNRLPPVVGAFARR